MVLKLNSIVLFFLKSITYFLIGFVFFGFLSISLPQLARFSRTLVISLITFVGVFFIMLRIYGNYNIHLRRSKAVVVSLVLCVFFTDIITYLVILIMSFNAIGVFEIGVIDHLLVLASFVLQFIFIYIMVYGGNELYFAIYKPNPTCLIVNESFDNERYFRTIRHYSKQYKINDTVDYLNTHEVYKAIENNHHVFLLGLPLVEREQYTKHAYKHRKIITFTPNISDIARMNCIDTSIDDVPLLTYNSNEKIMEHRIIKRAFDVVFSLFAILLTLPIWVVISIIIKIEDGGKVFFVQDRVTINNDVFKMIKFRSMKEDNGKFKQAVENDDRITKIGKFIRRFRIDELPQFINVLVGDMSIVGPRPEAKESYDVIQSEIPEFEYRTRVKAGITGLAQIYGRYNTPPRDKLKFDITYIERFSIMLDIKLIFLTISVFFKKESVETNKE